MIGRIASTALLIGFPALALAGPQYTASQIESHFGAPAAATPCPEGQLCLQKPRKTRAVCIGTGQACAEQEAAQAKPAGAFDLLITFELGSDRLSGQARENLAEFAKALSGESLKDATFNVDGHTDARGSENFNLGLSERRAAAVVRFLEDLGIDRSRLAAEGHGETQPRDTDPFAAINRRVEATIRTR